VHVARGSDDVATITLEADTGHITATNVYAWNIGAMVTATDANAVDIVANTASIAGHTTDIAGHTVTLASHTASHASHTTTLASHTTSHASHTSALATLTAATSLVDNVADADKPVSMAGLAANAALLATGNEHVADGGNPHAVSAVQVGLGACDDTADMDKPVSTAQQAAIDVAAVFRHSVVFKTGAALEQSPSYSPAAGTLTATVNGALSVGHAMAVADRLLVAVQGDTRQNGIYIVSSLGGAGSMWLLTRSTETLVGGMALSVEYPISALVFLTGSGQLVIDAPVLADNDWVVWATPGAAVVPSDLSIATLTCSGAASTAALDAAAITGDSLNVTGVMNCGGASTVGGAITASAAMNVTGLLTTATIAATRVDCAGDLTGGHVYSASGGSPADIRMGWWDAGRQSGWVNSAAYTVQFCTGGAARVEMSNVGFSVLSGTKNFRIDHVLAPATMWLQHASVEGPEVLCYYRGRSVVGADGTVVAPLPAYWMALNCEPSYQLTAIGAPQPNLHIAAEVADSAGSIAFTIGGGVSGASVAWVVTGRRCDPQLGGPYVPEYAKTQDEQDAYAAANP
jgi:hypothetical protein